MASSEYDPDKMVMLYNPAADHRCNLPELAMVAGNGITDRTIMECDQCAQRWWAHVNRANFNDNRWHKLRWYHFRLRSKIA